MAYEGVQLASTDPILDPSALMTSALSAKRSWLFARPYYSYPLTAPTLLNTMPMSTASQVAIITR
ncbi:hypothetical protein [Desulfotalea psychrophila]|uniref:hypothetical protein n=1 Tax=Desulfotalea psychrophila TaxID=84980 RepID=UPI0002F6185C|nr:hypothetical protein [Desulfotalea psychrophila]